MKLKIGMVGTNFISDDFCDATRQVPGAEVCAIYSRKQETGDVFAQKHGIPCVYMMLMACEEGDGRCFPLTIPATRTSLAARISSSVEIFGAR